MRKDGHRGGAKRVKVEAMFNRIAPTYDRLNHLLSLGIDRRWRRKAVDVLKPYAPLTILDIATGTGDFAILAARRLDPDRIIGIDISESKTSDTTTEAYDLAGRRVPLSSKGVLILKGKQSNAQKVVRP